MKRCFQLSLSPVTYLEAHVANGCNTLPVNQDSKRATFKKVIADYLRTTCGLPFDWDPLICRSESSDAFYNAVCNVWISLRVAGGLKLPKGGIWSILSQ